MFRLERFGWVQLLLQRKCKWPCHQALFFLYLESLATACLGIGLLLFMESIWPFCVFNSGALSLSSSCFHVTNCSSYALNAGSCLWTGSTVWNTVKCLWKDLGELEQGSFPPQVLQSAARFQRFLFVSVPDIFLCSLDTSISEFLILNSVSVFVHLFLCVCLYKRVWC
jgi:hypothetical protein